MNDEDGNISLECYFHCFDIGGSQAVFTRIKDRHLTDAEIEAELDRLKRAGWRIDIGPEGALTVPPLPI